METAFTRLVDAITKSGSGTVAAGAKISVRDTWTVLTELHALRLEHAELKEAYDELKKEHDGCM